MVQISYRDYLQVGWCNLIDEHLFNWTWLQRRNKHFVECNYVDVNINGSLLKKKQLLNVCNTKSFPGKTDSDDTWYTSK